MILIMVVISVLLFLLFEGDKFALATRVLGQYSTIEGRLHWPELTPPEYLPLDELAHEEGLRFGACTPFEKELIRKDGTRVPVLIATAVLKLSPFKWNSSKTSKRS